MSDLLPDLWRQHMRRSDFEAAWRISDRALHNRDRFARSTRDEKPTWRGEPLDGKRVLVHCCYGLGDTLQFVRYVPLLRRVARHVTLHAQASLARVLEHVEGIDSLVTRYNDVPPETYDVAIELSELPHVFRTSIHTIPARIPYICVVPRSFPVTANMKVGLVWRGSDWDPRRSVPLRLFARFQGIAGLTLHIVQRGGALMERPIGFGINSGDDDLYEAARTIAALDLMVTIDSMPAHLAGAMGVPTWVLLHSRCDWRWMENRTDSPWYPAMRLFRQKDPGDWPPLIAHVKQELERAARSPLKPISVAA
ncbi:MAG TPA: hypothetical protein VGK91_01720 [Candidatus Udaeobacter sp.]|jgi:hypothetical protein